MTKQTVQHLISEKVNPKNKEYYNSIYKIFNENKVYDILNNHSIEKTRWIRGESSRSLSFKCADTKDPKELIEIFAVKNEARFKTKFKQAVSGDGQEATRIRTLHSSALLSLLCFYGVEDKLLRLKFDNRSVTFTSSEFEVKNAVAKDSKGKMHYSNIDVLLCGVDDSGKKVKLFLESKFSEYLAWGKYSGISDKVYGCKYKELANTLKEIGLVYNDGTLCSDKGRTRHYAGGIKQMISHFVGLENMITKGNYPDADIYLGTILYEFPKSVDEEHKKLVDYKKIYKNLAEGLNALTESKFKIIEHCFTYQEVFNEQNYAPLDENVKKFYFGQQDKK